MTPFLPYSAPPEHTDLYRAEYGSIPPETGIEQQIDRCSSSMVEYAFSARLPLGRTRSLDEGSPLLPRFNDKLREWEDYITTTDRTELSTGKPLTSGSDAPLCY